MTNGEKQLRSMLNYYQIELGGNKDEKMSKREQKKFLDNLNSAYDAYAVQDILSKIKDKIKGNKPPEEESDDPFFDSIKGKSDDESNAPENPFPLDMNSISKAFSNIPNNGKMPFGMNPEIEMFINWLSDLLYSADHKVVVRESDDGLTTNIELQKIKKKRGGRKK
jgi:hypothetical protein